MKCQKCSKSAVIHVVELVTDESGHKHPVEMHLCPAHGVRAGLAAPSTDCNPRSGELQQLTYYLVERPAFCFVYRVLSGDEKGREHRPQNVLSRVLRSFTHRGERPETIELELCCGVPAYADNVAELAALYKVLALDCYKRGGTRLFTFDPTWQPGRDGRRWRGGVIATGPTRAAGYAIVFRALAKDDAEMIMYVEGIQRIMRGEQARDLPLPGHQARDEEKDA